MNNFFQHRLFSHQLYNLPESIHTRNKEALAEQVRLREEREKEKNKFKKLKRSSISKDQSQEDAAFVPDLDEPMNEDGNNDAASEYFTTAEMKFAPVQLPPKQYFPSPIGKLHTVGPQINPDVLKQNFDGERDMLKIFEAIRRQPPGFFLYLTHTFQKSSNKYNFYNVK